MRRSAMRLRKRNRARSRGTAPMSESRRDRRALARDAGLGRISVVSLLGGVATALTAFAVGGARPARVGRAGGLTALGGAGLGGMWGERWHPRLVAGAADPAVGRGASARVAAGNRLRGDSGMVDVGERLGTLPQPAE